MDLLHHYQTSSDSENSLKEKEYPHHDGHCNTDVKNQHETWKATTIKNNHNIKKRKTTNNPTSNTKPKFSVSPSSNIILLSSPKEIQNFPSHFFKRTRPHIQGNWSSCIYILLQSSLSSCSPTANTSFTHFDNFNQESYEEFSRFIMSYMIHFHRHVIQLASKHYHKKDNSNIKDTIVIVPYFNIMKEVLIDSKDNTGNNCSKSHSDDDGSSDESTGTNKGESNDKDEFNLGLHISLSKQFYLQQQSVQPFLNDLERRLRVIPKPLTIQFDTASISNTNFEILVNDDKTRSFLTIPVLYDDVSMYNHAHLCNSSSPLHDLVNVINDLMIKYGLESYYSEPKFHCSVASWKGCYDWITTDITTTDDTTKNNDLNDKIGYHDDNATEKYVVEKSQSQQHIATFLVNGIHCKFGTVKSHFITFKS
mmetsp:Transcript_16635/g.19267  ORF Transcript_16635/g.19267 Transcript_16635/m.19267 type:complete len:422 (-) Transcript_16635:31-1296(-)